jgi:mono/diheme cytochrome c family protein
VSPIGRWCAAGAVALGAVTVATWDRGVDEPAVAQSMALDGEQLMQAKGCAACHAYPDSIEGRMVDFPSLADAAEWAGERKPGLTAEEYLTDSIRTPNAFISPAWTGGGITSAMPELNLSDAEIDAIVAYLLEPDD